MQLNPLQGKVDLLRLALTSFKDGRQRPRCLESASADGKPSARVAARQSKHCRWRRRRKQLPTLGRSHHRCDVPAGVTVPAASSVRPPRELAVSRGVLLSFRTHLLDERYMSSGSSIQAVHRSSRAVALHGNSRPRAELRALESPRSAPFSPNTLLVRAWRSLIALRIDDALASVAQFENEIARAGAPLAPRSREFAGVVRAILLVLKSQDMAELMLSLHRATPQDSRLPAELRPCVTESLSPREHSILRSMSCGLSNKRIAQELQIAPETVKSHVKSIFIKLAVQTRAHAVSTANALGLL